MEKHGIQMAGEFTLNVVSSLPSSPNTADLRYLSTDHRLYYYKADIAAWAQLPTYSVGVSAILDDGTVPLQANWDADPTVAGYEISAYAFNSKVETGDGPPFTVQSSEVVPGLNSYSLQGLGPERFLRNDSNTTNTITGFNGTKITLKTSALDDTLDTTAFHLKNVADLPKFSIQTSGKLSWGADPTANYLWFNNSGNKLEMYASEAIHVRSVKAVSLGTNSNLIVQPSGYVGISQTVPAYPLDVSGQAGIGTKYMARYRSTGVSDGGLLVEIGDTSKAQYALRMRNTSTSKTIATINSEGQTGFNTDPTTMYHFKGRDDTADIFAIMPGTDTVAAGTPSIKVGIGTLTPGYGVDLVNGSIGLSSFYGIFCRDLAGTYIYFDDVESVEIAASKQSGGPAKGTIYLNYGSLRMGNIANPQVFFADFATSTVELCSDQTYPSLVASQTVLKSQSTTGQPLFYIDRTNRKIGVLNDTPTLAFDVNTSSWFRQDQFIGGTSPDTDDGMFSFESSTGIAQFGGGGQHGILKLRDNTGPTTTVNFNGTLLADSYVNTGGALLVNTATQIIGTTFFEVNGPIAVGEYIYSRANSTWLRFNGSLIDHGIGADTSSSFGLTATEIRNKMTIMPPTSNSAGAVGLLINMKDNTTNYPLELRSNDVNHAFTSDADADTFFQVLDNGTGGVDLQSFKTGNNSFKISGNASTVDTTKSTAGNAAITLSAGMWDGATGGQVVSAEGNLVTISNYGSTRFIFDAEGDFHADSSSTTFDDYDDVALIRALEVNRDPNLKAMFGDYLKYNKEALQEAKIATFNEDGSVFVNYTNLAKLHSGAIFQLYERFTGIIEGLVNRLTIAESKLALIDP